MNPTRRHLVLSLSATVLSANVPAQPTLSALPQVDFGHLERLPHFPAKHVASRHVDIWLPPDLKPSERCAVIYMHDGQMLFDASTTWNRQAWNAHKAAQRLHSDRNIPRFMIVGVWNTGATRFAEYFPQGFLPFLPAGPAQAAIAERALRGPPLADAYLRFLTQELKPMIDQRFPTRADRQSTFVLGSSMGGLISLYALCEYPEVFAGAAALSTHWIGFFDRNDIVPSAAIAYLQAKLPAPGRHRVYMDRGTTELDALYDQAQPRIDALLQERGWKLPDFTTRVFEGEGHNETAWAKRLDLPLRHLLNG
jgi:enterochelin esterase-like enzyme